MSGWRADRCLRDERGWGGIQALYRDFCAWHGPDFAVAPNQFEARLVAIGVQVERGFAKGVVLREDMCVPGGHAADVTIPALIYLAERYF
jgi:hypothetical protein